MGDFIKDGFNIRGGFRQSPRKFLDGKYTVCIKYRDGKYIEHEDITQPWRYISAVKKNMVVEDAWIKEE